MSNQNGSIPLILLIIILVTGGLVGVSYYLSNKNIQSQNHVVVSNSSPSPTSQLIISVPFESTGSSSFNTSNWNTYVNQKFGISF